MIAPMGMTPQVVRESSGYESTNPELGSRLPLLFGLESGNRPMIESGLFSPAPTGSVNQQAGQVEGAMDL